jgi:predicted phosphodiesterase
MLERTGDILRTLIVSDVHSNLEALEAVLAHAAGHGGFDRIWCLGDLVGYGPDPSACLERMRGFELVAVAGNHDYAAAGVIDASDFNGAAYAAIRWTAGQLDTDEKNFLAGLPTVSRQPPFTLVHGSLRDPIVEYLLHPSQALATFELLTTPYCLVGHSHYPFVCRDNAGLPLFLPLTEGERVTLDAERCIFNPGSVGQPRDHDPRSSYALFDDHGPAVEHHRVEYDIAATQGKMRCVGLPHYLVDRLEYGA